MKLSRFLALPIAVAAIVATAPALAAPKFSPTMQDYGGYTLFEATLRAYNVPVARAMMGSPAWKRRMGGASAI